MRMFSTRKLMVFVASLWHLTLCQQLPDELSGLLEKAVYVDNHAYDNSETFPNDAILPTLGKTPRSKRDLLHVHL